MKLTHLILGFVLLAVAGRALPAGPVDKRILFIGNSFTFGAKSGVVRYKPETVTDINKAGTAGVPVLFESFTRQAGLRFTTFVETLPSATLEDHYREKLNRINAPWQFVVMHTHSLLDPALPNDPSKLVTYSALLAQKFKQKNPRVQVYLASTWSRADQVYEVQSVWRGTPIEQMALDIRQAYNMAYLSTPNISGVIPVGEAWNMAFASGLADSNPYNGVTHGKINLWSWDSFHASNYGYYLYALVVFYQITGVDPRTLGPKELCAYDLGMSEAQAVALQSIAYDVVQNELP